MKGFENARNRKKPIVSQKVQSYGGGKTNQSSPYDVETNPQIRTLHQLLIIQQISV